MTVTTLFRRTTLATSLLLALAGCSVMTPYKVPSSALEAPREGRPVARGVMPAARPMTASRWSA